MEQPHCVRLIKVEWTSASLERTLRCRAPWSSPMPQIVLIRLKRKAFPEVISHLVPCIQPIPPPFSSLQHIFILHAYKPVQKPLRFVFVFFIYVAG